MAAGDLDTSFDGNGKKAVNFGGSDRAGSRCWCSPTAGRRRRRRRGRRLVLRRAPAQQRRARHELRRQRQEDRRLRRGELVRVRRGAPARRQDRPGRRRRPRRRGRPAELERLARHHVLGRRPAQVQVGFAEPRDGRDRAAQRQARAGRLHRSRGRQHAGGPHQAQRRARHRVRHRRPDADRLRGR